MKLFLGLGAALLIGQIAQAATLYWPDYAGAIDHIVLPIVLVVSFLALANHAQRGWKKPARELIKRVKLVRAGELPIDELSKIHGGIAPLAHQVQDLLRESRESHRKVAELQHEMSDRIAHRTEALERMIGSLRQQATRDALTGLYNRRMLDQHLPQLIETCRASHEDLCVLMIDLDNFKLLNDTLGHAEGDALLRSIGQLIRSSVRQNDAAFRCGGDEFLIVLPATDPEAAQTLADRLTSLVDALAQTLRVSPHPRLSIGQARLSEVAEATPDALLSEADKALYEQKSQRKRHQRNAMQAKVLAAP